MAADVEVVAVVLAFSVVVATDEPQKLASTRSAAPPKASETASDVAQVEVVDCSLVVVVPEAKAGFTSAANNGVKGLLMQQQQEKQQQKETFPTSTASVADT